MDLEKSFVEDIRAIWTTARGRAYTLVNRAMIEAYWAIGKRIVEEEQKGSKKARYGAQLLRQLAAVLTQSLDKHLDERELRRIRQFFLCFPSRDALRPELTWTHYRLLLRVSDDGARSYYLQEAADQSWGTRQLERNIQSLYYARRLTSRAQPALVSPSVSQLLPPDLVKDPYVLEFLGLDLPTGFSEHDLETAILNKLHDFLLELGRGFAFVGRQYSIKTDTRQYFIDLVFYNYLLKCFVLVDLKITELTHQDIGQLDMYVRMFDNLKRLPGDNPTVGIILCSDKDETLVRYSVLEENRQLLASRYAFVLPTEAELSRELDFAKQQVTHGAGEAGSIPEQ